MAYTDAWSLLPRWSPSIVADRCRCYTAVDDTAVILTVPSLIAVDIQQSPARPCLSSFVSLLAVDMPLLTRLGYGCCGFAGRCRYGAITGTLCQRLHLSNIGAAVPEVSGSRIPERRCRRLRFSLITIDLQIWLTRPCHLWVAATDSLVGVDSCWVLMVYKLSMARPCP